MSETNPRATRYIATVIIYLALLGSVLGFNVIRSRAARNATPPPQPEAPPAVSSTRPYFSLTTNRSYSPNESARLWASYQNIDYLDFRVYRIKDPNKFFKQLDDPHQMGEKEKEAVSQGYGSRVSVLERAHSIKISIFSMVRDYVRSHLLKQHRETFNQKFRKEEEPTRTPLNIADYARVPLLNPDQKVKDWRERLPALENEYDSRMISLGKVDPGVYLIEAVNEGMRAYSLAIITNLTMIEKTNRHGQVVIYVVDRKTGAPHEGVAIEVTKAKQTLATGATDKTGVFKTEVKLPDTRQQPQEDVDPESQKGNAFLVMARERWTEAALHGEQRFSVSVVGEVKKAGRYELEKGSTVFDAIARADGFTEFASPSGLSILRLDGTRLVRILVDDDTETSANVEPDTALLRPGDMVVVP